MKPYQQLRRFWETSGGDVIPAERTEGEVAALESRYGVRLPGDFRDYLLWCCPADYCEMVVLTNFWWTFSDIRILSAVSAGKYLIFADFLIWAPAWAIACGDDENRGRIVASYGDRDSFVADSFSDFVERFLVDPLDLT